MKVLHLNSYYIDNHLYSQLYGFFEPYVEQKVYIPIKQDRKPENVVEFKRTELIFEKVITPLHKYNYFGKVKTITKDAIAKNIQKDVDFVHAHNLFTDGALAYQLKKKFGLEYIVAVRATDIGLQYKLMYHRRPFIKKVLKEAKHIIFISPTNRDKMLQMMPSSFIQKIKDKIRVIPNGINEVWLNNTKEPSGVTLADERNLIYVGQIMRRKNLFALIDGIELLRSKSGKEYRLTVVGGANVYEEAYYEEFLAKIANLDWVFFKGKIMEKDKLMQEYRQSDIFVMPSKSELFGLVYIEALSQGLPVLYSKNEGINGYLEGKDVGMAVDPDNIEEIATGIENIADNYQEYKNFEAIIAPFNWGEIVNQYLSMYGHE
ncbi:glycosyltransferase family 4 protein [Flagellimonas crocea]|uniref:glycosyltransferase family 4 protein n=1 Tax=Flagellimonas crocea TaxID=3067311 RepID=UPI00296ED8CF|nr:glycosyltransferase family 4 protein [Muricauda sp. DH64]